MRLRTLVAVALAALAVAPAAGAQEARFHYPVPAAAEVSLRRDVTFMEADGKPVRMDVYRPAREPAAVKLPALIFLNTLADRPQRGHPVYTGWAAAATARGLAAIHPDAAPRFAEGLDALLAHLRANAGELGIDPGRIAVYAASGNVSQALPAVLDPKRTGIHAAVIYYGAAQVESFRPDLPILFVRAGLDRPALNRDLDELAALALRQNAPVRVLNHAGGHHAFEMIDDNDATRAVIDETLRFVTGTLDPRYRNALHAGISEARAAGAMLRGDFGAAATLYGELVAKRPDDRRLKLSYGEALLAAGRIPEARAQFEALKGAGLGPRDLGLPAARAALADGDPDGAIDWLKTIPQRFLPANLAEDPAFAEIRGRPDFRALFP